MTFVRLDDQSALFMQLMCDGYDVEAFRRAVEALPALREDVEAGARLLPGFEALALDLFCVFFKYQLAPRSEQSLASPFARAFLGWVTTADALRQLRAETTLDVERAAVAVESMTRRLLEALRDPAYFSQEELLEGFELANIERGLREMTAALKETRALLEAEEALRARLEAVEASLSEDIETHTRDAERLRREATRRIEALPAKVGFRVRGDLEGLPDTMSRAQQLTESYGQALGGGVDGGVARQIALGARLLHNDALRRLADLVGALKMLDKGRRRRRLPRRPAELHAVEIGAELGRMLPVELARLRHPVLKRDFMRRLLDGELMQYALRGRDQAGRGPMVVCIDGSASMGGEKEVWAKAVGLALLERCRRERRGFDAIVFSGHSNHMRGFELLPEEKARGKLEAPKPSLEAIVDFAGYFPAGGTRFEAPLEAALEHLTTSRHRRGDIVLITDGEVQLESGWIAEFNKARGQLDAKVYVVLVDVDGRYDADAIADIADEVTSVSQLTAEDARGLFRALD